MRILSLLVCLLGAQLVFAGGIEFFHGTFEEAKAEAKKENKIIFVDAYTTWCGPCKRMAAQVFPDDAVGDYYNANFVALKLDMEKSEGISFRQTYPVSAYPTLLYIDYDGTLVQKVKGAQTVENFISLGKSALSKIDRTGQFVERYEAGDRDPELVFNYVKALNQAGKSSGKVVNEYLNGQDNLDSPQNLKFLLEAVSTIDSRAYDLLSARMSAVIAQEGAELVAARIERAGRNTVRRAVEFQSEDLLELAKNAVDKYSPAGSTFFAARADMSFYRATGNAKKYLKGAQQYEKSVAADNPSELHQLAKQVFEAFPRDKKALQFAERVAAKSIANKDFRSYYTYAEILVANGKSADAVRVAKEGIDTTASPGGKRALKVLIEKIERV